MRCRYCVKFKSVTLASGDYPKGQYKTDRLCSFLDTMVNRDDDIFKMVKIPGSKTRMKEFCEGFELDPTFYCEQGYTVSVVGCLKRQEEDEMECHRCKKKYEILEMKKVSFLMQRKREKAKFRPKPIVR